LFFDGKPENAAAGALGMTGHVHTDSARPIARIAGLRRASPRPL
jgi:hypothetical protein